MASIAPRASRPSAIAAAAAAARSGADRLRQLGADRRAGVAPGLHRGVPALRQGEQAPARVGRSGRRST